MKEKTILCHFNVRPIPIVLFHQTQHIFLLPCLMVVIYGCSPNGRLMCVGLWYLFWYPAIISPFSSSYNLLVNKQKNKPISSVLPQSNVFYFWMKSNSMKLLRTSLLYYHRHKLHFMFIFFIDSWLATRMKRHGLWWFRWNY